MTDAERIEALLDLVDEARAQSRDRSEELVVLGLAVRLGRDRFRPTKAGWNLLGERGRGYDDTRPD